MNVGCKSENCICWSPIIAFACDIWCWKIVVCCFTRCSLFFLSILLLLLLWYAQWPRQANIETFKFILPFNGYFTRWNKHFQSGYCWDDKRFFSVLESWPKRRSTATFAFLVVTRSPFTFENCSNDNLPWFIFAFVIQVLLSSTPFTVVSFVEIPAPNWRNTNAECGKKWGQLRTVN